MRIYVNQEESKKSAVTILGICRKNFTLCILHSLEIFISAEVDIL